MSQWREHLTDNRYFYHYLFWAVVLLSYFVDAAELRHFNAHLFFRTLLLKNGLLIAIVYFNLRVLIPAFLVPKHYVVYALTVIGTVAMGTFLTNQIEVTSWSQVHSSMTLPLHHTDEALPNDRLALDIEEKVVIGAPLNNRILLDALTVCRYLVISILLKFIDDFFRQREELQQIQHQKTIAELSALKAQINPHFLFNTLNNLYGLVLERSDLAAETVLKLADIMKYTLSEGDATSVPLWKDLDNLRHYFDLESLRLPNTANVTFTIDGKVENQRITPLLLLPLVENAFKHGVHRSREKPLLAIEVAVTPQTLELKTLNLKPPADQQKSSLSIGLQNVRKRLDLLYPGRYQLEIIEDHQFFRVHLKLQL